MMATGFLEVIMIAMVGGVISSGGILGLPPKERDANLLKTAPTDALLYSEWAERGPGKEGAPGVDGLMADPEIVAFYASIEKAILTSIKDNTAEGGPEEQILGRAVPPLVKLMLTKPGCLYVHFDQQAAAKAIEQAEPILGPAAPLLGLKGAIIVNGGKEADEMAKNITEILTLLPPEMRAKDLQNQTFPIPVPGLKLTLHRHETYFIVAFGEGTLEAAIAGVSGKSTGGLGKNARFTKAYEVVQMDRVGQVSWIDIQGILKSVTDALGVQGAMVQGIAKSIGADALDSVVSATGLVDGQIRTKSFTTTSGKTEGILALAAGRGMKPEDFKLVPADADMVLAFSLDAEKVFTTVRTIIAQSDPTGQLAGIVDQTVEQLEKELQLKLKDDIFQAFGHVWTIHDSPSAGGLLATSLIAGLEVKDAAKAKKTFEQLMKILDNAMPGVQANGRRQRGVVLEKGTFLDHTIYYVNTVGDDDVPFAPAFTITDKRLLVAPHPQALKAHLRYLASKEDGFDTRFGKVIPQPQGDLLSVGFMDSKSLVRYIYAFAPYFGQVVFSEIQREGVEIDIFSLPSARAILPYTADAFATTVRTKDGILSESQSALPIPGGSTILMQFPTMLPWMFLGTRSIRIGEADMMAAPVAVEAKVEAVQELEVKKAVEVKVQKKAALRVVVPAKVLTRPKVRVKEAAPAKKTAN